MAEDKNFHILQLRSMVLCSTTHPKLCRLLSSFVANQDFGNHQNKIFHTNTDHNVALAQYFANFPNEIKQIFGKKPSISNQYVLYRNPSTKDIRIEIMIEQFNIPSLIMILTCNKYFRPIEVGLRKALNFINAFHKLSLDTSKQEWRDFSRGVGLKLFPDVKKDKDLWEKFAGNMSLIDDVVKKESLEQEKIVILDESELLQNFFLELIKFQCRNPLMDAPFETFQSQQ